MHLAATLVHFRYYSVCFKVFVLICGGFLRRPLNHVIMFFCENCGGRRFDSRTLFLMHVAECQGANSIVDEGNFMSCDETQDNYTWSLLEELSDTCGELVIQSEDASVKRGEGISPRSSPLTFEQLKTSTEIEKILHGELSDGPNEYNENPLSADNSKSGHTDNISTQSFTDPVIEAKEKIIKTRKAELQQDSSGRTNFQTYSVNENICQELSNNKQLGPFLEKYKSYLINIKLKIEGLKDQRKTATKQHNFNKSRRISRNIKKHQKIIAEIESGNLDSLRTVEKIVQTTSTVTSCSQTAIDSSDDLQRIKSKITSAADTEVTSQFDKAQENVKRSNKKKKKNYCVYCKILVTNFSRHIERKHCMTPEGRQLCTVTGATAKEKEQRKKKITNIIIKKWNDEYNEKLMSHCSGTVGLIPVKKAHSKDEVKIDDLLKCAHCLGLYNRKKLSIHLKLCPVYKSKIQEEQERNSREIKKLKAISEHSIPLVPPIEGMSKKFLTEVIGNIKNDEVGKIVKNDPLILLFGVVFFKSRMHSSELSYVRKEMRTLATLLMHIKKIEPSLTDLESCISVAHFKTLVKAIETWSRLNEKTGSMNIASVPYRILTPLNECIQILQQKHLQLYYENNSVDRKNVKEIEDFETLVKRRWSSLLGKTATKSLKSGKTLKTGKMALECDIYEICSYITRNYGRFMLKLSKNSSSTKLYDHLLDLLLAHILCLCRRRPVDLTRATLKHYECMDDTDDLIKQAHLKPGELLSEDDIKHCKFFKTFYVPGKNYDKVPVVLTPQMKDVLDLLIKVRPSVQITSEILLIKSENKPVNAGRSLEKIKEKVKLRNPNQLTALGLRHHAATFSKLHSTNPHYQDFLASAMGHTLFIHKTKYDLPLSVLHKVFVAPTLHSMTTGERSVYQTRNSAAIPSSSLLRHEECATSSSSIDNLNATVLMREKDSSQKSSDDEDDNYSDIGAEDYEIPKCKRKKWSTPEKYPIFKEFANTLLSKKRIPSKKIIQIYEENPSVYKQRTQKQVISFTNNISLRKVKNVTPELKKFKKVHNIGETDGNLSSSSLSS